MAINSRNLHSRHARRAPHRQRDIPEPTVADPFVVNAGSDPSDSGAGSQPTTSTTSSSSSSSSTTSTASQSITSNPPRPPQQTTSSSSQSQNAADTDSQSSDPQTSQSTSTTSTSTSSTSTTSTTTSTSSKATNTALGNSSRLFNTLMSSPTLPSTTLGTGVATGLSADATSSPGSSSGLKTGSIVGIAAGGLVGFGILILVGLWIMKRIFKRKDDDFDRNSFIRNSTNLEDVEDYSRPRPPTMIERHTAGAAGIGAHGYSNFVPPVPPMDAHYAQDPFMTPVSEVPPMAENSYQQHPYSRAVSPPHLQSGQYPAMLAMPPPAHGPEQGVGYANLERAGATAYQEAQYAELSRRLHTPAPAPPAGHRTPSPQQPMSVTRVGSTPPAPPDLGRAISPMSPGPYGNAQLVTIPEHVHASKEANVQYGYHDPSPPSPPLMPPPMALRVTNPSPSPLPGKRPTTVYDDEDVYGGM